MPVVRKSSVRAALAVIPMALAVVLGSAGLAHATEEDGRATIHDGNVDAGQKDACEKAGLAGTPLQSGVDLDVDGGDETDEYLHIAGVAEAVTVSGIVVKGGDHYNVYVPGELGLSEAPPWMDLRAPLNHGGNIPTISHWLACGVSDDITTTTTPPTKTTPSEPTKSSESTPPKTNSSTPSESTSRTSGETSSSAPSTTSTVGGSVTTTTTPGVVVENASNSGDLASTGFGSSWLLWAGGLLVLAGAAVLVLLRVRRNA